MHEFCTIAKLIGLKLNNTKSYIRIEKEPPSSSIQNEASYKVIPIFYKSVQPLAYADDIDIMGLNKSGSFSRLDKEANG